MGSGKRRKKVFLNRMKVKLIVVMLVFLAAMIFVGYKVFAISHGKGEQYEKIVLAQQRYDSLDIPYRRGDILDSNGTVLATSKKVYNVILEPMNINKDEEKREATIAALVKCFDIKRKDIEEMLSDSDSLYKVALKKQDYELVKAYNEYLESKDTDGKGKIGDNVIGVWFEEEYNRYYPLGDLACHVLGFTASGNVGQGGIEAYYNEELNGTNGRYYGYLTSDLSLEKTTIPAEDGYTVISTLDANVQNIIENKVDAFMKEIGANHVSVLAMDPNNGEILGLYNSNTYNPNEPYDTAAIMYQFGGTKKEKNAAIKALTDEEKIEALNKVWRNYVINDTFEPGSTYKTFTVAAALEENELTGNEHFNCDGGEQVANYYIRCHKVIGHGDLTLAQSLAQSCNDAMMAISAKMGRTIFSKYQDVFGFGYKTNVDLPGEAYTKSLVYDEEGLNEVELATSSFGQGLNVSMIQLASAFCSVVNGGDYYQPHVVKQIVDTDGAVIKNVDGVLLRKTLSKDTTETLKDYLFEVVESGTAATNGHIDGYTIGGKTGTAEKLPRGNDKYILSFICAVPIENPQVVLYVTVDEPNLEDPSHSGIATVVAKSILEELLPYMNIFQSNTEDNKDGEKAEPEAVVPIFDEEKGDVPEDETSEEDGEADQDGDGETDQDGDGETDQDDGDADQDDGEADQDNGDAGQDDGGDAGQDGDTPEDGETE